MLSNYKIILWDFDGVLMNSNKVRDYGFLEVLKEFPKAQVDELLKFHQKNGGLSRYVKFRYFFETIRNEKLSENEMNHYLILFSEIMKQRLLDKKLLITDSINFIKKNYTNFKMHIASGSDQTELRYICKELKISNYFLSINGSPTPKKELVKDIIHKNNYKTNECVFIGDSINDYEAANVNNIDFYGYNNLEFKNKSYNYIESFKSPI